jgi:hypothetical protein
MSTSARSSCSACIAGQQERLAALVFVLTCNLTEIQRSAAAEQWHAICAERGWETGVSEPADSAARKLAG